MFTSGVAMVCVAGIAWALYMKYKADNEYWTLFVFVAMGIEYAPWESKEKQDREANLRCYYMNHPEIPTPPEVQADMVATKRRSQQALLYASKHIPFYCVKVRRRAFRYIRTQKEYDNWDL